jgi:hypothetical protein
MKLENAQLLSEESKRIARIYSNPARRLNLNKETFSIKKIIPLSESVAVTIFEKNPSKKNSLCVFFFVQGNDNQGFWLNFFPTDSHVLGMLKAGELLQKIEAYNFQFNFEEEK